MSKNRITEIREARGMTVQDLAAKAGFSAPYVSQMALGARNISLKNLERLAAALDCQPEDLLATSGPTNTDVLAVWASIPVDRRELALTVLQNFTHHPSSTAPDSDTVKSGTLQKRSSRNPK